MVSNNGLGAALNKNFNKQFPTFPNQRDSLRSSRFLSFSRRRSNKQAKKRASEGARLGCAKQLGRNGEEVSEKGRDRGWGEKESLHPFPLLLIFCTPSQFRSLRVRFWKRLLRRLCDRWTRIPSRGDYNTPSDAVLQKMEQVPAVLPSGHFARRRLYLYHLHFVYMPEKFSQSKVVNRYEIMVATHRNKKRSLTFP